MTPPLQIRTVVSSMFDENTYVVWLPGRGDAVVIDPGLEPDAILEVPARRGPDRRGDPQHARPRRPHRRQRGDEAGVPRRAARHRRRRRAAADRRRANLSALFGLPITSPPADRIVREGDVVEAAGLRFEVLDMPGHSPGHVVFVLPRPAVPRLRRRRAVPRRHRPLRLPRRRGATCCTASARSSSRCPDDTVVYPGHGPVTTVGHGTADESGPFTCGRRTRT